MRRIRRFATPALAAAIVSAVVGCSQNEPGAATPPAGGAMSGGMGKTEPAKDKMGGDMGKMAPAK